MVPGLHKPGWYYDFINQDSTMILKTRVVLRFYKPRWFYNFISHALLNFKKWIGLFSQHQRHLWLYNNVFLLKLSIILLHSLHSYFINVTPIYPATVFFPWETLSILPLYNSLSVIFHFATYFFSKHKKGKANLYRQCVGVRK